MPQSLQSISFLRHFFSPLLHIILFAILLKVSIHLLHKKQALTSMIESLGKYSYGIYLVHMFFFTILSMLLKSLHILHGDLAFYPLLFAGILISSFICVRLLNVTPGVQLLMGNRNAN
ncbi:acyltransferase family protein [Candidatus Omnitrophota bacterium]